MCLYSLEAFSKNSGQSHSVSLISFLCSHASGDLIYTLDAAMPIQTLDDIAATTGPLLGLDPGTKTLGLAISDRTRLIATPLKTIRRTKFTPDAQELIEIYEKNDCVGLVIGLPVNMDGSAGPRVQSVKDFANNLLKMRDLPIFFWDERLSTLAVTRGMLAADMSRKKRAENVDKLAAGYILQGVLDRLRT